MDMQEILRGLVVLRDGSQGLTADWDAGAFSITANSFITDTISEEGAGNGVTIDGVLLKDNAVTADTVTASTFSVDAATNNHSILDVFDDLTFYNTNTAKDIKFFTQIGEVSNLTLQLEGATNTAAMANAAITNLTATNIGAFNLTGKLTAGANEIEGSAFDINGGTLNGIDSGATIGTLTLANGSITDSGGAISFGNENLLTTGTGKFAYLGINTTPDSSAGIINSQTGLTSTYQGMSIDITGEPSVANQQYRSMGFAARLASSSDNVSELSGVSGDIAVALNSGYTGTCAEASGFKASISIANHFASPPTFSDVALFRGVALSLIAGVPVTAAYGLKLPAITGATANWAIYSAGGDSSHAGDFRIGSNVAPTVALDVTGAAKIGDGTNELQVSSTGDVIFAGTAGLAFAEIYISDNDVAQTIGTGATYTKLTGTATNGAANNCTADGANTKITITKAGIYKISAHFDGKSDTANVEFEGAIFVDGTIQNNCRCKIEFVAADKNCSSSIVGLLDVAATKDIDFRVRHDNGGDVDLTIGSANISVIQIGGT